MMTLKKLVRVGVIALVVLTAFENSKATTYTFDVDPSSGIGSGFFSIDLPDSWPGNIGRSTVIPAASLSGSRAVGDEWVSLAISLNEPLEDFNNAVLSGVSTSSSGFSVASSGIGIAPVDAVSALPGVTLRTSGVPDTEGPNHPPTISCPSPATLECNNGAVAVMSVVVNDKDGDPLVVIWTIDGAKQQTDIITAGSSLAQTAVVFAAIFESGEHTVQVSVSDGKASPVSCTTSISVQDFTPPTIQNLVASPNVLSSPNHRLVPVALSVSASDNCGPVTSKIKSVKSNEPISGLGKGDLSPDWIITGDLTLQLRAERGAKGRGRIYTITVETTDSAGNSSTGDVTVAVP
jgi:hypothetical protein